MKYFLTHFFLFISLVSLKAQAELLAAGPMVGYSTMKEVALWVQTKEHAHVRIEYWTIDDPKTVMTTEEYMTLKEEAYSVHLIADQLEPGHKYGYRLFINDQEVQRPYPLRFQSQTLWQYRTDPPDFKFIAGSCFYINEPEYDRPGKPYGSHFEILDAIGREQADFMMWLGDNIYLREVDWNSRTGIYHRYTHMRSLQALQPLLGSMHHYAIWDDHDYGPNDSDRSFWGKKITEQAFKDFWANPNYDLTGKGGITGTFFWSDCQFFLLDNRYHRSKTGFEEQILGDAQIQWLIDALRYSKAQYKFICIGGQFLSDAKIYENYANYEKEKERILYLLDQYNIHGVVFLTGDRHSSEITKLETKKGNVFYDVTSSALTSKTYDHKNESNTLRMDGTMIGINNYAVLEVQGAFRNRKLTVIFKDSQGEEILRRELVFPPFKRK